jgi:hypothetical protein
VHPAAKSLLSETKSVLKTGFLLTFIDLAQPKMTVSIGARLTLGTTTCTYIEVVFV